MTLMGVKFYDWLIETGDLGVGPGLWCPLHIVLMVALFLWIAVCFVIFSKHKQFALKFTKVICYLMIGFRIGRMLLLMISGKTSIVAALPWHLCHIMAIVFPLFFLTGTKKFFLPIVCVTLFGGVLTFIFGDYYKYEILSFLQYESLFLHFCMPTVVVGVLATGWLEIKMEDFWQIPLFLLALAGYASIGNALVPEENFLYLKENGLPFNLFGSAHFYFTYAVLLAVLAVVFIALMWGILKANKQKNAKFRNMVRQK